jgi:hypothetical protein
VRRTTDWTSSLKSKPHTLSPPTEKAKAKAKEKEA